MDWVTILPTHYEPYERPYKLGTTFMRTYGRIYEFGSTDKRIYKHTCAHMNTRKFWEHIQGHIQALNVLFFATGACLRSRPKPSAGARSQPAQREVPYSILSNAILFYCSCLTSLSKPDMESLRCSVCYHNEQSQEINSPENGNVQVVKYSL